eukprot:ANDGO_02043.mRNA.1 Ultraviolet-B receptor UVR8
MPIEERVICFADPKHYSSLPPISSLLSIIQVSSTNNAVFAVTSDHNLYYKSYDSESWHHATELANRVSYISSGFDHSLVLTTSGEVLSFGSSNEYGQLGRETTDPFWVAPVGGLERIRIVAICCGAHHSLAVDESGVLYSWGYGGWGQLGHGEFEHVDRPKAVASLRGKVIQVAAGAFHTLILTDLCEVHAAGCSTYGQLGLGDTDERASFEAVDVSRMENECLCAVHSIYAGGNHSALRMEDGSLYFWGMNVTLGAEAPKYEPLKMTAKLTLFDDHHPSDASLGSVSPAGEDQKSDREKSSSSPLLGDQDPAKVESDMAGACVPSLVPGIKADSIACGVNQIVMLQRVGKREHGGPLEELERSVKDMDHWEASGDGTFPVSPAAAPRFRMWCNTFGPVPRDASVHAIIEPGSAGPLRIIEWKHVFAAKAPADLTFAVVDVQQGVNWKTLRSAAQEMYISCQRVMQVKPMVHHLQSNSRDLSFHGERITGLQKKCESIWPKREAEIEGILETLRGLSSMLHGEMRDEYRLLRHSWNDEASRLGLGQQQRLDPRWTGNSQMSDDDDGETESEEEPELPRSPRRIVKIASPKTDLLALKRKQQDAVAEERKNAAKKFEEDKKRLDQWEKEEYEKRDRERSRKGKQATAEAPVPLRNSPQQQMDLKPLSLSESQVGLPLSILDAGEAEIEAEYRGELLRRLNAVSATAAADAASDRL